MSLEKALESKSKKAQALVEYIVSFIILVVGIIVVFGTFSPDSLSIGSIFKQGMVNAVEEMNK